MFFPFMVYEDLIGMVTDIGNTQIHAGSKKQQINLVLKDLGFVQFNSFISNTFIFIIPTLTRYLNFL